MATQNSTNTTSPIVNTKLGSWAVSSGSITADDTILSALQKLGSVHASIEIAVPANGLSFSAGVLSLDTASATTTGALGSADWEMFNNKENGITSGLTTQYFRGDKTWATLTTDVVPEGANLYYTAARFNTAFGAKTTSDLVEGSNLYFTNTRADDRIVLQKGVANGIATLDSTGLIPSSQLPQISITDTFVVASQAAMLALSAQTGDVAVRTDLNKSYILKGTTPSVLSDWQELLTPTDSVLSVNGLTGSVVLTTTNISEGTNLYYTQTRFDSAFAGKTTTNLAEGTNLYYTQSRFDSAFGAKTTSNLSEGSNLYFTNTRATSAPLTGYVSGSGTVVATDSILQAIQKLNGNIVTISTHNNLSSLQGGTSGQYYHLSSAEYTGSGTGIFARVANSVFTGTTQVDSLLNIGSLVVGGQSSSASVGIELGNVLGGTPYIDFKSTSADYNARFILGSATNLQLFFGSSGTLSIHGSAYIQNALGVNSSSPSGIFQVNTGDSGVISSYAIVKTSVATANQGGLLITNADTATSGYRSFKITSTYNGSPSFTQATMGFVENTNTESFLVYPGGMMNFYYNGGSPYIGLNAAIISANGIQSQLTITSSVSSTTQTVFTQSTAYAGMLVNNAYVANGYTGGLFNATTDINIGVPKWGIYGKLTGAGSYIYMGTSNNYANGLTNTTIIDPNGYLGIGGAPTTALTVTNATPNGVPNVLIYNTNTLSSTALEFKDAGATPNRWWIGTGLGAGTDGIFFIHDYRQSATRVSITTGGQVRINGATNGPEALDVNGSVSLNNYYTSNTAQRNPGYFLHESGESTYGMKLHYTGSQFGTLAFAPSGTFVGWGRTTSGGTASADSEFSVQMQMATVTGCVGINTAYSELTGANSGRFTSRQTANNSASIANGWIAGVFGGTGGTGSVVVMGGASNKAIVAGHSYALDAWADLYLNYGGGKVLVGNVLNPVSTFQVGDGGSSYAGTTLSTRFVVEGGTLGATAGNEVITASFCATTPNISSLGVHLYRASFGTDWQTASVGLCLNVDNALRASNSGNSNSLWINPRGNINVGTSPYDTGGNFIVSGSSSPNASNTVYITTVNTGTGGNSIDIYSSNNAGYLGPSVGFSMGSASPFKWSIDGAEKTRMSTTGMWGFFQTSPNAYVHLGAGTNTVAPLKLTSGTNLSTTQDGAFEYDGTHLYFTIGSTRTTII